MMVPRWLEPRTPSIDMAEKRDALVEKRVISLN